MANLCRLPARALLRKKKTKANPAELVPSCMQPSLGTATDIITEQLNIGHAEDCLH